LITPHGLINCPEIKFNEPGIETCGFSKFIEREPEREPEPEREREPEREPEPEREREPEREPELEPERELELELELEPELEQEREQMNQALKRVGQRITRLREMNPHVSALRELEEEIHCQTLRIASVFSKRETSSSEDESCCCAVM